MSTTKELNFNDVYRSFNEKIFKYIVSRINNSEYAEELTQDTFVRISKHLTNFDEELSQLNTWIFTIVNNILIDFYRKNNFGHTLHVSDYVDDNGNDSFQFEAEESIDLLEAGELREKILTSFSKLKGKHKRVAQMYLLEGHKYEHIAEVLDIPLGTVKGTLRRAKDKLKGMLAKEYTTL